MFRFVRTKEVERMENWDLASLSRLLTEDGNCISKEIEDWDGRKGKHGDAAHYTIHVITWLRFRCCCCSAYMVLFFYFLPSANFSRFSFGLLFITPALALALLSFCVLWLLRF